MTKLILTIGVAALAVAFQGVNAADGSRGPAYEETQFDRTLPNIPERVAAPKRAYGSPYEEFELERALPQLPERVPGTPRMRGAPYEETLLDRSLQDVARGAGLDEEASAGASMPAGSVWDKDHEFVAPAQ